MAIDIAEYSEIFENLQVTKQREQLLTLIRNHAKAVDAIHALRRLWERHTPHAHDLMGELFESFAASHEPPIKLKEMPHDTHTVWSETNTADKLARASRDALLVGDRNAAVRLAQAQRDDAVDALREFQWAPNLVGAECRFCGHHEDKIADTVNHICPDMPGLRISKL